LLNPTKRGLEQNLQNLDSDAYQKALFYMYGGCVNLENDSLLVHG